MSPQVSLITENWLDPGGEVQYLCGGLRFFGSQLAADFGFLYPLGTEITEGFPFLPLVGFTYNFNLKPGRRFR